MLMELSEDQKKAKTTIIDFLTNKNDKLFVLKGSAGTGKSTLITHILSLSQYKDKKIALCATTHKAVAVLKDMKVNKDTVNFITIHKLLKIKRRINGDGVEGFMTGKSKSSDPIHYYDIIIIDECSMIDKELLKSIFTIQNKILGKIIFIGDVCQLPPVNEIKSSIFTYNLPNYELKEIMRYKGKIVNLCNDIRTLIFDKSFKLKLLNYKSKKINFYNDTNSYVNNFVKKYRKEDTYFPICITYTNKRCNHLNQKIRNLLFDNIDNNKYVENELIIFNNFYQTKDQNYYTSQKEIIKNVEVKDYVFSNFKLLIMKILDKKIEKYCDYLDIDEYERNTIIIIKLKLLEKLELLFQQIENLEIRIYEIILQNKGKIISIYEKDTDKYNNFIEKSKLKLRKIFNWLKTTIKIIEKSKKIYINFINDFWDMFYNNFIDKFCDIDYGYSITTHKSQASTFNSIYVDMNNIINCNSKVDESYRCLYTAITRTSNKLNILL